ncbi:MAG: menaquinone biosynthesis protein [Desulfuromonadaceae bacterium]|nr:menaquinone biosynthesis protein [Desulfuromonadaceae bacterium]MDD2847075.1 menaquinone biosynthesis protein [Desulfuromonadaceae bacterium]MDD4128947.1 menaquinone biosynthesis protein [Desulfuromonadaceae bacterium]
MKLRIGEIEYANCTPLFHVLREQFPCSGYEFITGVPAALNRRLLAGDIDVCPSSSIEYAYHPERYSILPQLSISSDGAVASVLLFSRQPVEALDGCKVLLSSESATSVNLLKILLYQRYGCSCTFEVAQASASVADDDSSPLLLIGDSALRASLCKKNLFVYDLGELWHSWTGLPFVFALWLCRNEVAEVAEIKTLSRQLIQAKELVPECLGQVARCTEELKWLGYDRLMVYWRENISYHLGEREQAGLMLYYAKCAEIGLIKDAPALHFISS